MSNELKVIQKALKENSSPEVKASSEKFVPQEGKVYGVTMPVLNELAGKFKSGGLQWQRVSTSLPIPGNAGYRWYS